MRIADSRRLTGPSLLLDVPGAVLDIDLEGGELGDVAAAWRAALTSMLEALGWSPEPVAVRVHPGGCSLAFAAPFDALYAATEINEWAFGAATRGAEPGEEFEAARIRLEQTVERERSPSRVALALAARGRGLAFLTDDKRTSVGLGAGSRSWPTRAVPLVPQRVRWAGLHDVPVALVTGTNGKTTTVRLLGAMARAAGRVAGITSTDRVDVGDEVVAVGDYSGPNGARTVLRDRRVQLAVLEVARGGILRRGLPVTRADVALVTNVANDHLGEYGVHDLDALADAKLVVAKAVAHGGRLVLNADDPLLLERGAAQRAPVTWFTLDPTHPRVRAHVAAGGDACALEDGALVLHHGGRREVVAPIADVPIALGGAARHNLANALAAIGVASAVGLPLAAIARGLAEFSGNAANPGRTNLWTVNGAVVIVDFAHNPHGLRALVETARGIGARRRALVIGQAGDRDDASIADLAHVAASLGAERVFVKELETYRRGRERGAVPALIEHALRASGAADAALSRHASELDAVDAALGWAEPGDVVVLTVHEDRDAVADRILKRNGVPTELGAGLPRAGVS